MTTQALVPGSLGAMAQSSGVSLAESFLSADVLVIVDVSGSMASPDSRGGETRYNVACQELTQLQANLPGKVGVIAFSSWPEFVPGGVPPFQGGGTDLAAALKFVRVADGTVRFIVISDGEPDSEADALAEARRFKSRIDTIFVGSEEHPFGADFLRRLAKASGGQHVMADRASELATKAAQLMLT